MNSTQFRLYQITKEDPIMHVTFLIGNGFDVNLGLATRYTDFYPTYIKANEHLPDDNCIKKFCMKIKDNYQNWSDFESAFAEYAEGSHNNVHNIFHSTCHNIFHTCHHGFSPYSALHPGCVHLPFPAVP